MHDYSIDKHPKEKILFALAFLAITITPWLNTLLLAAASEVARSMGQAMTLAVSVGVTIVFAAIYWVFNRYLWRVRPLRRVLLVPDINGRWVVSGTTVIRDGKTIAEGWSGTAAITQSWSKISIIVKTQTSESKSVAASVSREPGNGYRVIYHYRNVPEARQTDLHSHSGTAEIVFDESLKSAEGYYFTDQGRRTVGEFKFEREKP